MAAALPGGGGEEKQNLQGYYQFLRPNTEGWAGGRDKGNARKNQEFPLLWSDMLHLLIAVCSQSLPCRTHLESQDFQEVLVTLKTVAEHPWLALSTTALSHSQESFKHSLTESLIPRQGLPSLTLLIFGGSSPANPRDRWPGLVSQSQKDQCPTVWGAWDKLHLGMLQHSAG